MKPNFWQNLESLTDRVDEVLEKHPSNSEILLACAKVYQILCGDGDASSKLKALTLEKSFENFS